MKEDLNIRENEYTYMLSKNIINTGERIANTDISPSVLYNILRHYANPVQLDRPESPASTMYRGLRTGLDGLHVSIRPRSNSLSALLAIAELSTPTALPKPARPAPSRCMLSGSWSDSSNQHSARS